MIDSSMPYFLHRPQDKFVSWLSEVGVLAQWYNLITYSVAGKAESMAPGTFTVSR